MTSDLESEIKSLGLPSKYNVSYYTGPHDSAPPSINNHKDASKSTIACMQDFDTNYPDVYTNYDGYLVACYSDHPLVYELQSKMKHRTGVVVMGIFQASMLYAMNFASPKCKAAILTSGKDWEPLLNNAIVKFCTGEDSMTASNFPSNKFLQTLASGIPVLELHTPEKYPQLKQSIQKLMDNDVRIILLGCAGFSSVSTQMKSDYPNVKFVDSVKVGVRLLLAYVEVGDI